MLTVTVNEVGLHHQIQLFAQTSCIWLLVNWCCVAAIVCVILVGLGLILLYLAARNLEMNFLMIIVIIIIVGMMVIMVLY